MVSSPPGAEHTAPRSRSRRQQETRDALVLAALATFARDGYHAATLETVAGEAGFSKGAVYSNFGSKADLFLAVMDFNLETLRGDGWDPVRPRGRGREEAGASGAAPDDGGSPDAAELVRGFGLATLEFAATAARDDALSRALRGRVQAMVDAYARVAEADRPPGEVLPVDDVATLMAALDQGVAVLGLIGTGVVDGALLRAGLRRLLDPASAAAEPAPARGGPATPHPDVERVHELIHERPRA